MSNKPMFICITGIDGVGKTTHVNLILDISPEQGCQMQVPVATFSSAFVSLPLLAYCRLAGYTRVSSLGEKQKCSYHEFYRSKAVSAIYPCLLLIDTAIFMTIKVYIPMFFGTTIVCDRFVYDTLIDLAMAPGNQEIYKKIVGKLFLELIPQNSKFVCFILVKNLSI